MEISGEKLDALWVRQVFACHLCSTPAHGMRSQMVVLCDDGEPTGLLCPECVPWHRGRPVSLTVGRARITSRGKEQWPVTMDLIDRR